MNGATPGQRILTFIQKTRGEAIISRMNTSTTWIWAAIVVIVLGAGWYWYASSSAPNREAQVGTSDTGNTAVDANASSTATTSATVTFANGSFSPSSVTIAAGGTVRFVNESNGQMWIASNPHPVHTGYDGTAEAQHCAQDYAGPSPFDQCSAGNNFSFTFTKVGSWGYHNHANPGIGGTVVVQ